MIKVGQNNPCVHIEFLIGHWSGIQWLHACDLLGGLGAANFDTVGRQILRLSDIHKQC